MVKSLLMESFLPLCLSEVQTRCERTQQTGEFLFVCGLTTWMEGVVCGRLWLQSILCVLPQILRLRKLRSGLHEEGRTADDAAGAVCVFGYFINLLVSAF